MNLDKQQLPTRPEDLEMMMATHTQGSNKDLLLTSAEFVQNELQCTKIKPNFAKVCKHLSTAIR